MTSLSTGAESVRLDQLRDDAREASREYHRRHFDDGLIANAKIVRDETSKLLRPTEVEGDWERVEIELGEPRACFRPMVYLPLGDDAQYTAKQLMLELRSLADSIEKRLLSL